jgi:hypothetical protein
VLQAATPAERMATMPMVTMMSMGWNRKVVCSWFGRFRGRDGPEPASHLVASSPAYALGKPCQRRPFWKGQPRLLV